MTNDTQVTDNPKNAVLEDIRNKCMAEYAGSPQEEKICKIQGEFANGLTNIQKFSPTVTFYGSALIKEDHPSYSQVYKLAYRIGKELKFNIISGGGGGVMEAANKGAFDAGVRSIGCTIKLPHEQKSNDYVTDEIPFEFFFARQTTLSYCTEPAIFCPGGFGTLDELFEMLTLQHTHKQGNIPIILFGVDFQKDKLYHSLLDWPEIDPYSEKYLGVYAETVLDKINFILSEWSVEDWRLFFKNRLADRANVLASKAEAKMKDAQALHKTAFDLLRILSPFF